MTTAPVLFQLSVEDFTWFRDEVRALAGIGLGDSKRELMQSRLRPRIQQLGLSGFTAYRKHLEEAGSDSPEWQILVNLITTNKTDFFREPDHFDWLFQEFLPAWRKKPGNNVLRIWSAACSTGEEPYSLALALNHAFSGEPAFEIVASDIDTTALQMAKNGVYRRERVAGVVPAHLLSGFSAGTGDIVDWMKVKRHIRDRINFRQVNLIDVPYDSTMRFDLIFCRNVFIYFPPEVISTIVKAMHAATKPGGALIIGQSESLQGIEHPWKYCKPSIFLRGEK